VASPQADPPHTVDRSAGRSKPGTTTERFWTNTSVLELAAGRDPVDVVTERARQLVLAQIEKGWTGPPYDPFELAERLRIPLVPRGELRDARTVPDGKRVRIEYNPNRPRSRLRFSIAHELGHVLFPDAAKTVRHRGGTAEGDDWQLEMLCNIAASEILMPTGSFPELGSSTLDLNQLMRIRREFQVSTEALLRRIVRLTSQPTTFFAASRIDGNDANSRFRIEYWVGSTQWSAPLRRGLKPPARTVLRHCTAVGYSDHAVERWGTTLGEVDIQCVGVSPYPGQNFPRVVGLLSSPDVSPRPSRRIREVDGDATKPRVDTTGMIVHLVNDRTPNWGGPFARALRDRYPMAQEAFRTWARADAGNLKLGNVHFSQVAPDLTVATMIAQHGFGRRRDTRFSYVALQICLEEVARQAAKLDATVHMPRIGAGEAGGRWSIIRELINEALVERDLQVTIYTPPGAPIPEAPEQTLSLGV
jgi:O-acetyl-ADP-ribose deacetylase (regulator of RNase III)